MKEQYSIEDQAQNILDKLEKKPAVRRCLWEMLSVEFNTPLPDSPNPLLEPLWPGPDMSADPIGTK